MTTHSMAMPGEYLGQRSLAGYRSLGLQNQLTNVTFSMCTHTHTHRIHTGYIYTHTYIHAYVIDGVVHYITVKNKILLFVTIWMNVMDIASGINQTEGRQIRCGFIHV